MTLLNFIKQFANDHSLTTHQFKMAKLLCKRHLAKKGINVTNFTYVGPGLQADLFLLLEKEFTNDIE